MNKPVGYDEAQAYTGDFQSLPPGGYICVIKKAAVELNKNDHEMLKLAIDIADGEQKDFFQKQFEARSGSDRKWPAGGTYYQGTQGTSLPFFKGLITSIEKSNYSYQWNWDERSLVGKSVGFIFRREEYLKQDGSIGMSCKPFRFCSVDTIIQGVEAPEDKLLPASVRERDRLGDEVRFDEDEIPF